MELIDRHIYSLNKLCNRYHISARYVFGSAATGKFTGTSNIDYSIKSVIGETIHAQT